MTENNEQFNERKGVASTDDLTSTMTGISSIASKVRSRLDRPVSSLWCFIGWVGASIVFFLLVRVLGGPNPADAYVSANSTWSIAHGSLSCAYPPARTVAHQPLTAPLYPLISGAVAAIFRIGHQLPFPSVAQMGHQCANAVTTINVWSVHARSIFPTVMIGYIAWLILETAVVVVLRVSGRGRTGWEPKTVLLAAVTPPVLMCLTEYFHPQDLLAMGLTLFALAAMMQRRWALAGALAGLAMTSQQFAILAIVPALFVVPPRKLLRYLGSAIVAMALIDVPFIVATSGRALSSILVGTGATAVTPTLLVELHLGAALHPIARLAPIAASALLAAWASRRLGPRILEPVALCSLTATSLALRLVFEVNVWGYYFMAVSVLVLVIGAVERRCPPTFFVWLFVIIVAVVWGGLINGPAPINPPIWLWQIVLVPAALYFSAAPLLRSVLREPTIEVSSPVSR